MAEEKTAVVMCAAPVPDMTAEEFKAYYADKTAESDLADAYAGAHNQFWWVEDDVYDYEEGTTAYEWACSVVDSWGELVDEYEERIFAILKKEGAKISRPAGYIKNMEPFMNRNGYVDGRGWWIKEDGK